MSDDNKRGSGSGMLWYEAGRSSGYSDGEFYGARRARREYHIQEESDRRAGIMKVWANEYHALVAERDGLWEQGNLLTKLVDASTDRINFLENDIKTLELQLAASKEHSAEVSESHRKTRSYYISMDSAQRALVKAAEQGKTHQPEYQELKNLIQQMIDAWAKRKLICTPRGIGPRVAALVQFFDP